QIWSRKISILIVFVACVLSFGACSPVFGCQFTYKMVGNVTMIAYLDDACTITQKSRSSAVYFLYVIVNLILTALTSHRFVRLSRFAKASNGRVIVIANRNLFGVVLICTITQMIKATHRFCWVFVAAFGMTDLNVFLQNTYDITHYLATYSATVSLVIFNKQVRHLLINMRFRKPAPASTRIVL
ncbi:hypothetical protein PMAYCL1PPCAC_26321, partial [Pristionchus mayeri]